MKPSVFSLNPARVALSAALLPIVYVLTIGPERFYYESWGTWILSPIIYTRLAPSPLDEWLLRGFCNGPLLTWISCGIPVAMLFVSFPLALVAIAKNSLLLAFVALSLVALVFGVYHFIQPMGITYVLF